MAYLYPLRILLHRVFNKYNLKKNNDWVVLNQIITYSDWDVSNELFWACVKFVLPCENKIIDLNSTYLKTNKIVWIVNCFQMHLDLPFLSLICLSSGRHSCTITRCSFSKQRLQFQSIIVGRDNRSSNALFKNYWMAEYMTRSVNL